MRLDPQGELDTLFTSLDPLVARDPDADEAVRYFGDPTAAEIESDWTSLVPVAPLTWNESLQQSAIDHSLLMMDFDQQAHQLPGEPSPSDRAQAAGYVDDLGLSVGENVFAYANSPFHTHSAFAIDWAVPQRSHRVNLMAAEYRDVGIGIVTDYDSDSDVGPLIVTQDFGTRSTFDQPYLLGVVFDDFNEDGWYGAGEGLGDATIVIEDSEGVKESYTATSMSAGGYQIEVEPGVYTLTASGGGLAHPVIHSDIVVGADNVKVDFNGNTGPNKPPAVDLNGASLAGIDYATSFHNMAGAVSIVSPAMTVKDYDTKKLVSATVAITNLYDVGLEMVGVDTGGTGITADFDEFSGVLSLTGSDTVANYEQVLSTLSYYNGAHVPTGASRTVEVSANDGFKESPVAVSVVSFAPELRVEDAELAEGDHGTTSFVFAINLSTPSNLPVSVSYSFIDGTARAGSDYLNFGGQVTFQPGETEQNVFVAVNGDTTDEGDEDFYISLINPSNALIADAQAVGLIVNDDAAMDMGRMPGWEVDNLDPSSGQILSGLTAPNGGLLTLEALFDGPEDAVTLNLYDQARSEVPLAVSSPINGRPRIDWQTEADTTYYVTIEGSATDVTLRMVNLIDVDDGVVVVNGTDGDDIFEFGADGDAYAIVNGVRYELGVVHSVSFDGGDGYDTAHLTSVDPNTDDNAEIWPDHGTFFSGGVTVTLTSVESINLDGRGGDDTVLIHDSPGDDELYARPTSSIQPVGSITVNDFDSENPDFVSTYSHSMWDFEYLTTRSTNGLDVASFYDSDGDDTFIGKQFETVLSGEGFHFRAEDYAYTHGYAKAGGIDSAALYDTPGNDRFKGSSIYARMFKGTSQRRAKFFESVVAYSTAGGDDDARLFDSYRSDRMTATPSETRLEGEDGAYDLTVVSFDEVLVRAGSGGFDTATFVGGEGNDLLLHKWLRQDTLTVSPKTEMMDFDTKGEVYDITARRFHKTTAIDGEGGYDIAKFWDTLEDDRFVASGDTAALYSPDNELLYDAVAFDRVTINHVNGGDDTTEEDEDLDFMLGEYWP